MKKIGITLILASAVLPALAAQDDRPVLYYAKLQLPSSASVTASGAPNYGPYEKECSKKPGSGNAEKATGEASFKYYPKSRKLEYVISYSGLSGEAMMAHFHYVPTSGPIVQTICGKPPKNSASLGYSAPPLNGEFCNHEEHNANHGVIKGVYELKGNKLYPPPATPPNPPLPPIATGADEATLLANGGLYLNFHTCLNMGGEISGTITPGSPPKN